MDDRLFARIGSISAAVVGTLSVLYAIAYLGITPADQRGSDVDKFFRSYLAHPTGLRLAAFCLFVSGLGQRRRRHRRHRANDSAAAGQSGAGLVGDRGGGGGPRHLRPRPRRPGRRRQVGSPLCERGCRHQGGSGCRPCHAVGRRSPRPGDLRGVGAGGVGHRPRPAARAPTARAARHGARRRHGTAVCGQRRRHQRRRPSHRRSGVGRPRPGLVVRPGPAPLGPPTLRPASRSPFRARPASSARHFPREARRSRRRAEYPSRLGGEGDGIELWPLSPPPQQATKAGCGKDAHISDLLAAPAETMTMYGHDSLHGRAEQPGNLLGLPGGRRGVDDLGANPYLAPADPQVGATGLGVDDPHAARRDHDVVDVALRPRGPAIVQHDEAPGQPGQQPGGRHLGGGATRPAIGIGNRTAPPGRTQLPPRPRQPARRRPSPPRPWQDRGPEEARRR